MSVKEVAQHLNVSSSCVYQLVATGLLPCHRIGVGRGTIRISPEQVQLYLQAAQTREPKSVSRRQPQSTPVFQHLDVDRLLEAWRRQDVLTDPLNGDSAPSSESSDDP